MGFIFESRPSDSPLVEFIWSTQSDGVGGSFTSQAESHWEMVVTKQQGKILLSVRGPETQARPAPIPQNAEFFGMVFKLGTFMPQLPTIKRLNSQLDLPESSSNAFYLHGSSWQFPTFENADTFIERLAREGMLTRDPVVDDALKGHLPDMSLRSVQRRFLNATGLTHGTIRQIERAQKAVALLRQGNSILDTVYEAGYADQPHLTRALKLYMGQTPAQILRQNQTE